ncbi:ABC transporter substrate-binding protein [Paenibacillus chungangensis]|uniref:ABC transporter substrate-binding protein n=1 Tax=Paenibacillus chungangensis TaxID=696535 RepID=A0ABW3HT05_9BACL
MIKKSAFIIAALILSISTILSACSNEPANESKSSAAEKEEISDGIVTLKVWFRLGNYYKTLFEEFQQRFESENPHIKLEINHVPPDQYTAAMQAAMSANELPDLFLNGTIPTQQMVELGMVRELDELFPPEKKDAFMPGIWTEGQSMLNGKIYGVPTRDQRPHVGLVLFNVEMIEKAGYTEEELSSQLSWDKFVEVVKKTKEANQLEVGVTVSGRTDYGWFHDPILNQMSTAIDPEISNHFNYLTGEWQYNNTGLVESMQFFKKLDDDKLMPSNWLLMTNPEVRQLFIDGEAAFTIQLAESATLLDQHSGLTALPTKDGKPSYVPYNGAIDTQWMVSKKSEHFEEIKLFLNAVMDYGYTEGLQSGLVRSPIIALNESIQSDNPLFNKLTALLNDSYMVVPDPVSSNANAIDVQTEYNNKAPTLTHFDVLYGYLSGQLSSVQAELDKVDAEFDKIWNDSIQSVKASGKNVSKDDFIFPDWKPFENYGN